MFPICKKQKIAERDEENRGIWNVQNWKQPFLFHFEFSLLTCLFWLFLLNSGICKVAFEWTLVDYGNIEMLKSVKIGYTWCAGVRSSPPIMSYTAANVSRPRTETIIKLIGKTADARRLTFPEEVFESYREIGIKSSAGYAGRKCKRCFIQTGQSKYHSRARCTIQCVRCLSLCENEGHCKRLIRQAEALKFRQELLEAKKQSENQQA